MEKHVKLHQVVLNWIRNVQFDMLLLDLADFSKAFLVLSTESI